ncbi:aminoglycoside adenylyltransferase domain-containing protein [Brucella sp. NBRC 12950]|uniref:aminoglycoside adenylyltransferase domain-containing protein n=1 Tax=Brucella sp. NBRC 12950 TaxID=2994518 RepID=UPI00255518E6|nr:aminoglycoside adenylyltransferase domain-containing protein [Brucella sp. NBRC 12950]
MSPAMICRAIGERLPELIASVDEDERNVLLTLARLWRTLVMGDFASKDDAADWFVSKLSKCSAVILYLARNAYNGIGDDQLHLYPKDVSHAVEELKGNNTSALPVPYRV